MIDKRSGSEKMEEFGRERMTSSPWVYVEITQPDVSEAEERARAILNELAGMLSPFGCHSRLKYFFEGNRASKRSLILAAGFGPSARVPHRNGKICRPILGF
jgi:hypothetical protein